MLEGFATLGEVLRPDPEVVAERVQDETVLVHLQTNRIYALNRTAGRAWELLEQGRPRPAIERQLLEEFDVSNEQLDVELSSLFSSLSSEGLIRSGND